MIKTQIPIIALAYLVNITLFTSCTEGINSEIVEKIEIDPSLAETTNLSSFVKDIKYIKLENSGNLALGPGSIVIKGQRIFYFDYAAKIFYLFDLDGQLINSLDKRGEGPGEYMKMSMFDVNVADRELELIDMHNLKIIKYSYPNFELISERRISSFVHMETGLKLDNNQYLISTEGYQNVFDDLKTNAEFLLYDSSLVSTIFFDRQFKGEKHDDYIHYGLFMNKIVKNNSDEIYASVNFDNTIYKYEDGGFNPELEINYTHSGIDNNKLLNMSRKDQFEYFYRSKEFRSIASFPHLSVNNDNILIINYLFSKGEKLKYQESFRHYIHLKNSNESFNASTIVNDLTSFPDKIYVTGADTYNSDFVFNPWYDKYLVSVLYPASVLDHNQNIVLASGDSIKFDDNPVILLMETK